MAKTAKEQLGVDLPEPEPVKPQEQAEEKEEAKRPEWLPENFENEQEFANAYREAQNKIREQGESQRRLEAQLQEMSEAIAQFNPNAQQQQQQPQRQPGSNEGMTQEQLYAMYENDPIGTVAWLAQQASQATVKEQLQQFQQQFQQPFQQSQRAQFELLAMAAERQLASEFDDWGDYKDKVSAALSQDPSLLPESVFNSPEATIKALRNVYQVLKANDVLEQLKNGSLQQGEQMKQQAQTVTGTAGRPGTPSEQEEKFAQLMQAAKQTSYAAFRNG